jgi:SAM-dependent methyltransferase
VLRQAYDATWGRVFALVYDRVLDASEQAGLRDLRRQTLAGAAGRTLELGAGTGLNHDLYPEEVTDLVLTEPFAPMARRLRAKAPRASVLEAPAEQLPFPDHSFDTVVVTLVLCTVVDPVQALREVARVLSPGGRLLFLEHVRATDPRLARWQDRLHGPWYLLGHGCHCNRDMLAILERSQLTVERAERGRMPRAVPLVRPLLSGSARVPRGESTTGGLT